MLLFENLYPILDKEGTRNAYRLECDLLPMVSEMRARGIRIDQSAAEQARDLCAQKRDTALAELSEKLGTLVGMDEIGSSKWKACTFEAHNISYPKTPKGNPSFRAGKTGWMLAHAHWLPQLIARASKYEAAASKFFQGHVLEHTVNGRVHAEIHPHRSDDGSGTCSLRFSYSDPPLQQMPARDKELAPLVRSCFLPEQGETWCKPDYSQQEFRWLVHHALLRKLPGALQAAEFYRNDPDADFHAVVAQMTGIARDDAKSANFAKIFGAGVRKFAEMIGKPLREAQTIYAMYDQKLPFVRRLSNIIENEAKVKGYTLLHDGARRHWNYYEAWGTFVKGAGPCPLDEAKRRTADPGHPWFKHPLRRCKTHTSLNALIQGNAARHTKLWMRACWREGIIPLLQMHDCLDCSVSSPEQGELVARLGCEVVELEVPVRVDVKYGPSWGDATHDWGELTNGTAPTKPWEGPDEIPSTATLQAAEPSPPENTVPPPPPPPPNPPSGNGSAGGNGYASNTRQRGYKLEAQFVYNDLAGAPYMLKRKWRNPDGSKFFAEYHQENGRWIKGAPNGPKYLYRQRELQSTPLNVAVHICEGEKDCETLVALGFVATTNPNGALNWCDEHNTLFAGRPIVIHEDHDNTGGRRSIRLRSCLYGVAKDLRIVTYPELPEQGDVSDYLTDHSKEDLLKRIEDTPKWEPPKIPWLNIAGWEGEPVPEQEWAVEDKIPMHQCTLYSGEGGGGKSTSLEHLCAAFAIRQPWLDCPLSPGAAWYIEAEDEGNVIHRRLARIATHYGVTFGDIAAGGFKAVSFAGCDAVLAVQARNGKIEPTDLYKRLLEEAGDLKPKMIAIASSANVYAGSEIDRSQVQQFIGLMTRIAIASDGALVLASHPSLTGINTDTGISGTTQWHNAVRARFYMKGVKPEDGEQPDNDLREIVFKKNNYGPISASIIVRYENGLYLPVPGATLDQIEREEKAQEVFLELLKRFFSEGRFVSHSTGKSYAPALFAKENEAKKAGVNNRDLADAMRRLFAMKKITNRNHGKPSRPAWRIEAV